jgi:hypothetical protein
MSRIVPSDISLLRGGQPANTGDYPEGPWIHFCVDIKGDTIEIGRYRDYDNKGNDNYRLLYLSDDGWTYLAGPWDTRDEAVAHATTHFPQYQLAERDI